MLSLNRELFGDDCRDFYSCGVARKERELPIVLIIMGVLCFMGVIAWLIVFKSYRDVKIRDSERMMGIH